MLTLICLIFVILGALNWLLVGIVSFDFVAAIFGSMASVGSRIVYILIGLMALWLIYVAIFRRDVLNFKNDFNFKKRIK